VGVPVVEFDENTQSYSDNGYYITPSQVWCSSHTILACCYAERLRTRLKWWLSRASYMLKIIAWGVWLSIQDKGQWGIQGSIMLIKYLLLSIVLTTVPLNSVFHVWGRNLNFSQDGKPTLCSRGLALGRLALFTLRSNTDHPITPVALWIVYTLCCVGIFPLSSFLLLFPNSLLQLIASWLVISWSTHGYPSCVSLCRSCSVLTSQIHAQRWRWLLNPFCLDSIEQVLNYSLDFYCYRVPISSSFYSYMCVLNASQHHAKSSHMFLEMCNCLS
jgi:hypothetical protein